MVNVSESFYETGTQVGSLQLLNYKLQAVTTFSFTGNHNWYAMVGLPVSNPGGTEMPLDWCFKPPLYFKPTDTGTSNPKNMPLK